MNDALMIIGMLGAFLLGAYIRKPFKLIERKPEPKPEPSRMLATEAKRKEVGLTLEEEMTNIMEWTGKDKKKKLFIEEEGEPNED